MTVIYKPYYADESVTLHHGDCLDVLRALPDGSADAVVTDPPYALNFMAKGWDDFRGMALGACEECGDDDPVQGYRLCLDCMEGADERALRGASMLGQQSQNWHEKATHSRGYADNNNAAFQRWCTLWARECLRVLKPGGHMLAFGGSRTWHRLAAAVEDAGFEIRDSIAWLYGSGFPKAKSQLKPAFEPVVVGRKALAGTVAANVLAHGTGALNIDATRVEYLSDEDARRVAEWPRPNVPGRMTGFTTESGTGKTGDASFSSGGRWPTNVVLDESQAAELDRQSGVLTSGANPTRRGSDKFRDAYGDFRGQEECTPARGADSGGASRFFPTFRYEAKAPTAERPRVGQIAHPTVKPLDLMRWLVRLVTPPGGTVLEPFAGSGTTAEACVIEGFRCIAIEREADYLPLIVARLTKPIQPDMFGTSA